MKYTIEQTKKIEVEITFPCFMQDNPFFVFLKSVDECISTITSGGYSSISTTDTLGWLESHPNAVRCTQNDFACAMARAAARFECVLTDEILHEEIMVTIHDKISI